MESRRIAVGAIVAAAVLIFVLSSSAFGCLPAEDGDCSLAHFPLHVGLVASDDTPSVAQLQVTMQTLKSDVVEFADGTPNLAWNTRQQESLRAPLPGVQAQATIRGPRLPAFATMPDSDLAHMEAQIVAGETPANLIQVNLLKRITVEVAQREQELVTARNLRLANLAAAAKAAQAVKSVAPAPPPAPAPVDTRAGSPDPNNAPKPSGQPVYIGPKTTVWYAASDGWRRLTMYIDDNHATGLTMAIFGPDQQDVWSSKPVGMGAPGQGHDFFWTGRSGFKGTWRIRLTNNNDFGVPYTFVAMSVSDKAGDMCRNCHGNIVDEWDRCEHSGSFCDDLKTAYKQ